MKISGYQKNQSHCNNIYSSNKKNNHDFCSPLNSLFEVENFLCNLKKVTKCINLYKFLK